MYCDSSLRYASFALSGGARDLHRLWLSKQRKGQHRDDKKRLGHKTDPSMQRFSCDGKSAGASDASWEGNSSFASEVPYSRDFQPSWSAVTNVAHKSEGSFVVCTETYQEPHDGEDTPSIPDQNLGGGGTHVEPQYWYGCYGPQTNRPVFDPTP